jgi:hypothetical protein
LRAAVLLPLLTVSLRLGGFRSTQRFLQRFVGLPMKAPPDEGSGDRVAITVRMVLAAARNSFLPSTCLERSLCLWWLLARENIATQFRIGVKKEGEKFAAHAWVERDGVAIGEPESSHLHFAAFDKEMFGDER